MDDAELGSYCWLAREDKIQLNLSIIIVRTKKAYLYLMLNVYIWRRAWGILEKRKEPCWWKHDFFLSFICSTMPEQCPQNIHQWKTELEKKRWWQPLRPITKANPRWQASRGAVEKKAYKRNKNDTLSRPNGISYTYRNILQYDTQAIKKPQHTQNGKYGRNEFGKLLGFCFKNQKR